VVPRAQAGGQAAGDGGLLPSETGRPGTGRPLNGGG